MNSLPAWAFLPMAGSWPRAQATERSSCGTQRVWSFTRLYSPPGEAVSNLAWSPDGTVLASHSGREGTIRLWDTATRQELGAMVESDHQYAHPMFSSDGRGFLAMITAEPFSKGSSSGRLPATKTRGVETRPDGLPIRPVFGHALTAAGKV